MSSKELFKQRKIARQYFPASQPSRSCHLYRMNLIAPRTEQMHGAQCPTWSDQNRTAYSLEGHELADGAETGKGSANSQTRETSLSDGGIDDTALAEFVQQALGHLRDACRIRTAWRVSGSSKQKGDPAGLCTERSL